MNRFLIAAAIAATLLTGAAIAREDEDGSAARAPAASGQMHRHGQQRMAAMMGTMHERGPERMRAGAGHEHGQHEHGAAAGSGHEHGDCPMHAAPKAATR